MQANAREVAIFWDFQSCPAPADQTGYEVTNNLRRVAQTFGSIKLFKAYLAISEHARSIGDRASKIRSELQVSGVSLTDVPAGRQSRAADQMVTVDLLLYALDRSPTSTTLLLVTEDPDFTYAISSLRLRNYRVVVISSSSSHPGLVSQASVHYDWTSVVLKGRTELRGYRTSDTAPSPRVGTPSRVPTSSSTVVGTHDRPSNIGNDYPEGTFRLVSDESLSLRSQAVQSDEVELESFLPRAVHSRASDTETPVEFLSPRYRGPAPPLPGEPPFHIPADPSTSNGPTWRSLGKLAETPADVFSEREIPLSATPTPRERLASLSIRPPVGSPGSFSEIYGQDSNGAFNPRATSTSFTPQPLSKSVLSPSAGSFQPSAAAASSSFSPGQTFTGMSQALHNPNATPFSPPAPKPAALYQSFQPMPAAKDIIGPSTQPPRSEQQILADFHPLIEVLRVHKSKGTATPLRSSVALELIQKDKEVYKKVGAEKFAQYSQMAEKEGVVVLGGKNGGAWIQLSPKY